MKPTKVLYVDWSMPRKFRGNKNKAKKPWEIAMIIRSTFFSREYNNLSPILYCDPEIYEYYRDIGLDVFFDEIRPILPADPEFNPGVFWSAGKFYSILDMDEPFIMMDLDAEVRFEMDLSDCDIFCAHSEEINDNDLVYYPHPTYLGENLLTTKYGSDWDNLAYNTSILYFRDIKIAHDYANEALDFIKSLDSINPAFERGYILLAEQRLIRKISVERDLSVKTLISGVYKTEDPVKKIPSGFEDSDVEEIGQRGFLHVWGFKSAINNKEEVEYELFGNLLSTRLNLKDDIISCVRKSREMYSLETKNKTSL